MRYILIVSVLSIAVATGLYFSTFGLPSTVTRLDREWSGTGSTDTETFIVSREIWHLSWEYEKSIATKTFGIEFFAVVACKVGSRDDDRIGAMLGCAPSGSTSIHEHGKFYLTIVAMPQQKWTVHVWE